jgi:hypothetical protein
VTQNRIYRLIKKTLCIELLLRGLRKKAKNLGQPIGLSVLVVHKCVAIDPELKQTNPELYQSLLDFAKSNHLKICQEDEESEP